MIHAFHSRLCLFSKCVPLNIIGVCLFGFSFGWEVHKHRSRVQPQLYKKKTVTEHAVSVSMQSAHLRLTFNELMTEETF